MFFAANMSRAASCRNHAAKCLALAREARDPEARSLFAEMAVSWRELADMITKNVDGEDKEGTLPEQGLNSRRRRSSR
jgi:hypothetical protein